MVRLLVMYTSLDVVRVPYTTASPMMDDGPVTVRELDRIVSP